MNDSITRLVFLAHLASSLYMVGLIWFVQVVHYPLFAGVGSLEFRSYEQRHTALTTWVVAPPMLIEGATSVLLIWFRPTSVAQWSLWTGLALLGVSWLSTAFLVSADTEESHRTFARQHKLSFPLISDADGSLRKAFAVPKTMGLFPGRVTYVIDQAGIIRQIFSAQFASDEHVRQALIAVVAAGG